MPRIKVTAASDHYSAITREYEVARSGNQDEALRALDRFVAELHGFVGTRNPWPSKRLVVDFEEVEDE